MIPIEDTGCDLRTPLDECARANPFELLCNEWNACLLRARTSHTLSVHNLGKM